MSERSEATNGKRAAAVATLPHATAASAPAPRSRRNERTSPAKNTPDRSATASPARPGESNRPRKKSAMPAKAIPIAAASRVCSGSFTTSGEKRRTQTTPLY